MQLAYSIKQKVKIATLLFFIMTCSILITILEEKSIKSMNESFISMYNDRLIPSMDLFHISEHVYAKRSFIENILYQQQNPNPTEIHSHIRGINTNIQSLIGKYEKTFLVAEEKKLLSSLKNRLSSAAEIEKNILRFIAQGDNIQALQVYKTSALPMSLNIIRDIAGLMQTQKLIGNELIEDTAFLVSGSRIYSSLQIALAIFIGILVVGILYTSNVVSIKQDKFKLN